MILSADGFKRKSIASKKRWAKVEPAERSKQMAELARFRASKMTKEERKAHSVKMLAGKKKK